ncbi:MAG TPA: carboxypeptidase-like regulatory domain-containing protein, partial [Gemmatimonadaceae bacterium]
MRGTVTTDSGKAIAGADVIITMAPDRDSRSTKSDGEGHYAIAFDNGTGDYLVHVSAIGRETFRKRVTRTGTDSLFTVDAKLRPAGVQQLKTVNVAARKPKPARGGDQTIGAGASERIADGVNGAVPPDLAGDLNAISGTIPGVTATSGGVSVAGLAPSNNSTTLNGMSFPGADIPRDASTRVRVTTSTYDPARGWFSGVNQNVELSPGNIFSSRRGHLTLDAPVLQYTDPVSAKLGQRFTDIQASLGGDGSFQGDNFVYNYGLQGSRRMADAVSIGGAGPDVLQRAGLSSDSAARFIGLLNAAGIPIAGTGIPSSQINQTASFIGRIDHAPYNWTTFSPSKTTWGLQAYAKVASSGAVQTSPIATAAHSGKTSLGIGSLQALYSTYFGNDYLTEDRSSISLVDNRNTPYTRLPDGRVLVTSAFPDGTGGATSLDFGGNSALWSNTRQWTWETMSETQFYPPGKTTHRVKLTADSRLDGVSQDVNSNSLGTFAFNSLGDLAANQPSSFTRTLSQPTRTGGEWNGFVALGDVWRKSSALQLMYGARVEANRFTSAPANNPAIETAFDERTDNAPNTFHISPRFGFTWIRHSAFGDGFGVTHMITQLGSFYPQATSYIRGGFGEFRSLISPSLLTRASAATGLPSGVQSLACVGSAAPTPDWSEYLANAATVPDQCAGQATSPVFTDAAPAVQLFDRNYTA